MDVYGIWYLRTAVADDPALGEQIRETLRDLVPAVAASLAPPDRGDDTGLAGARCQRRRDPAFGLNGLNSRLKIIGVELT